LRDYRRHAESEQAHSFTGDLLLLLKEIQRSTGTD
jgi:hypothetical protein